MVKHIVMFKLKESLSENEKIEIMNSFKSAIEALQLQKSQLLLHTV